MSNFQAEPRPLFNERRSRVFVMKDDVPDISHLSESSQDMDKSRHDKSSNFLNPTPPAKTKIYSRTSMTSSQTFVPVKRSSNAKISINEPVTFVYDGIEDKVNKYIIIYIYHY